MPIKDNAVLRFKGKFTKKQLVDAGATHLKVEVQADFLVGAQTIEQFWCKIRLIGADVAAFTCTVDNDLEFTDRHGLRYGDIIKIRPSDVDEFTIIPIS